METKFECPHCNTLHELTKEETDRIDKGGKVVICCENCESYFTIAEDDDVRFVIHRHG